MNERWKLAWRAKAAHPTQGRHSSPQVQHVRKIGLGIATSTLCSLVTLVLPQGTGPKMLFELRPDIRTVYRHGRKTQPPHLHRSAQGPRTVADFGVPATMSAEPSFLFTSESVNEGHPDKICDQVSAAAPGAPMSPACCLLQSVLLRVCAARIPLLLLREFSRRGGATCRSGPADGSMFAHGR